MERNALIFILVLTFLPFTAAQEVKDRREELKRIQSQVEARKKKLDEYKRQEQDIRRYLSFLKKQKDATRRAINDVTKNISAARKKIDFTKKRQKAFSSAELYWKDALGGEIAEYVVRERSSFGSYGTDKLVSRLFIESAIYNKTIIVDGFSQQKVSAMRTMETWEQKNRELVADSQKLSEKEKEHSKKYSSKADELNRTKEQYDKTQAELEELKNSAQSLMNFLEKYEASVKTGQKKITQNGIKIARNSLAWPADGPVAGKFGREEVPALHTWVKRDGIIISVSQGSAVSAVASGTVIYSGPFRSYGNVVIVSHPDKQFFTVYGFLDSITVSRGAAVREGSLIGRAGVDTMTAAIRQNSAKGAVYFEIRAGTEAVDPLKWLANKH